MSETTFAWQETSLAYRERAEMLVEAMTLEQKIAQLHGAMEAIDIYAITANAPVTVTASVTNTGTGLNVARDGQEASASDGAGRVAGEVGVPASV